MAEKSHLLSLFYVFCFTGNTYNNGNEICTISLKAEKASAAMVLDHELLVVDVNIIDAKT